VRPESVPATGRDHAVWGAELRQAPCRMACGSMHERVGADVRERRMDSAERGAAEGEFYVAVCADCERQEKWRRREPRESSM